MAPKTLPVVEEQSADQEGQCTADDCCCGSMAVGGEEPQATVEEAADCGPDTSG